MGNWVFWVYWLGFTWFPIIAAALLFNHVCFGGGGFRINPLRVNHKLMFSISSSQTGAVFILVLVFLGLFNLYAEFPLPPPQAPPVRRPVAVVTGANKGIGYHTSERLGRQGWHVVLACRDQHSDLESMDQTDPTHIQTNSKHKPTLCQGSLRTVSVALAPLTCALVSWLLFYARPPGFSLPSFNSIRFFWHIV